MLSFYSEAPLPAGAFAGMAFDGRSFFLPKSRGRTVSVLNSGLCPVKNIKTKRDYSKICYDFRRKVFWALSPKRRNALFKLGSEFEELCEYSICAAENFKTSITDISFFEEKGSLLLSSGKNLLEFDAEKAEAHPLCPAFQYPLILGVTCLSPFILLRAARGEKTFFVLADSRGKILAEEEILGCVPFAAMTFEHNSCDLLLLQNRGGKFFLARASLQSELQSASAPSSPLQGEKRCEDKFICRREKRYPLKSRACTLKYISLIEKALARVLDDEGEKLRRADFSARPAEALEFDRVLQKILAAVTNFEAALAEKIEALEEAE